MVDFDYAGADQAMRAIYHQALSTNLPTFRGQPPSAIVDGIVVATPSHFVMPLTFGFELPVPESNGTCQALPFAFWSLASVLVTVSRADPPQVSLVGELPDTSSTAFVPDQGGALLGSFASALSSVARCIYDRVQFGEGPYRTLLEGIGANELLDYQPLEPRGGGSRFTPWCE